MRIAAAALGAVVGAVGAHAETVQIAYIDPLSGAFANVGDSGLKHFTFAAEQVSDGEFQFEVVGFDNKTDPKESLVQLQKAIDQGIRYIAQGNGSSVAAALIDAVDKHNARNPGEEVVFLNYAAVDPAFTNDDCSFWHFRFDADVDMKMEAMTDWLAEQDDIESVYIIGQDYSFGRAVSAAANRMIAEKRPDIEIVGDELHPLGKVKDFTPYVQKMMAADADAVITGNWGQDMSLLIKAASDSGQGVPYLTYYGGGLGAPTAIGEAGLELVKQVTEFHENVETSPEQNALMDEFEERYPGVDYYYQRVMNAMTMLDQAMEEAGTSDPVQVARAMAGMSIETPYGPVTMREDNHQAIQPLYISTFTDTGIERTMEGTPYAFRTDEGGEIEAEATRTETTCEMERPEGA